MVSWSILPLLIAALAASVLLGVLVPARGAVLLALPALMAIMLMFLRFPRAGVYLLAVLIPLQYLTRLENQATAIRYLGWFVFAAWLLRKLAERSSFRPLLSRPVSGAIVPFLLWALVSVLWSPLDTWEVYFFTFLQLAGMVFVFIDLVDSPKRLETFLLCLLVGGVVGAGVAIYEYVSAISQWQSWSRALGGFGDGNYSSASYMYVLPYALFLVSHRSGRKKAFALASVPLLLTAVGVTASRAGLISIPIWLLLVFRGLPKRYYRAWWFLVILCLGLLAVRFWPWATIEYRMSTAWTGGAPGDLSGRVGLWLYSLEKFIQRPLTGYGLTTALGDWGRFVPHNLFLQVAVRLGLPGLLSILWLLSVVWKSAAVACRRADEKGMASLARSVQDGMLLYLFFSLTLDTATARLLWLTFALGDISRACVGQPLRPRVLFQAPDGIRARPRTLSEP